MIRQRGADLLNNTRGKTYKNDLARKLTSKSRQGIVARPPPYVKYSFPFLRLLFSSSSSSSSRAPRLRSAMRGAGARQEEEEKKKRRNGKEYLTLGGGIATIPCRLLEVSFRARWFLFFCRACCLENRRPVAEPFF